MAERIAYGGKTQLSGLGYLNTDKASHYYFKGIFHFENAALNNYRK